MFFTFSFKAFLPYSVNTKNKLYLELHLVKREMSWPWRIVIVLILPNGLRRGSGYDFDCIRDEKKAGSPSAPYVENPMLSQVQQKSLPIIYVSLKPQHSITTQMHPNRSKGLDLSQMQNKIMTNESIADLKHTHSSLEIKKKKIIMNQSCVN